MNRELALMKRILLLLMMLILPLQSVWAGSDVDCQTTLVVACEHDSTGTSTDGNSPPSAHLDDYCACHLGHVDVMLMGVPISALKNMGPEGARAKSLLHSHITPPPERPQWA